MNKKKMAKVLSLLLTLCLVCGTVFSHVGGANVARADDAQSTETTATELTPITFEDLGMPEGKYTGNASSVSTYWGSTTGAYENTIFTGKFFFHGTKDASATRTIVIFGGEKAGSWAGLQMWVANDGSKLSFNTGSITDVAADKWEKDITAASLQMTSFRNVELEIAISFERVNEDDLQLKVYINKQLATLGNANTHVIQNSYSEAKVAQLSNYMFVTEVGDGVTLTSCRPGLDDLTELTFRDFGLADTETNTPKITNVEASISSYADTLITGTLLNYGNFFQFQFGSSTGKFQFYRVNSELLAGLSNATDVSDGNKSYFADDLLNEKHAYPDNNWVMDLTGIDFSQPVSFAVSIERWDYNNDGVKNDAKIGIYMNGKLLNDKTTNIKHFILANTFDGRTGFNKLSTNQGGAFGIQSTPETLPDDLRQLTFTDFGVDNDTYSSQVIGTYNNGATLIGTQISGYVTLNEDLKDASKVAWLCFGYNGWGGLQLHFQPNGSLQINTGSVATSNKYAYVIDPANIQSLNGKNFCGTRFKLTLSMEAANLDSDNLVDDVLLKVYINDEPAVANPTGNDAKYGSNGEYYILDSVATHLQGYMITQQISSADGNCSNISFESISNGTEEPGPEEPGPEEPGPEEPGPEEPVELTELTFVDFELSDKRYTGVRGIYNAGETLVGKEISGYVTLNEDLTEATANPWLVFGGTDGQASSGWDGVQLQFAPDGKTVYLNQGSATATNQYQYTFSADKNEGVTTFAGEKFKVKIAFEPANLDNGAEANDVRVKLYINDVLWIANDTGNGTRYGENGSYYILNVKEDNMQGYFTVKQVGATEGLCTDIILESLDGKGREEIIKPVLHKATLKQLGITQALYKYNNNALVASGQYQDTLMNSVFSTKLTFSVHDDNRMMYAGKPSAWHGINFKAYANGNILIHPGAGEFPETYWLTPEVAGTTLVGEEIDFKIELFESGNNAKLGVYINGELYDGTYFHLSGAAGALGNYVGFYVADAKGSIKVGVPEPTPLVDQSFTKLTFDSYGLESGTYTYNKNGLAVSGKIKSESLDRVVFSDTIQFSKEAGATLRIGGKPSAWHGLILSNTADGKLVLNEAQGKIPAIQFAPATAGTELTGKDIKLTLSFEYVDSDEDGNKDDVKLGVWFNGKAYGDRWFYLQDAAELLGGYISIYCSNENASLKIETYNVPIDFTIWGFTKRWAYELGLKKK